MNVDKYFNKVFILNKSLSIKEKEYIVDEILEKTLTLPIKKPFKKEQLISFADKDLIHYLTDVFTLFAFKHFQNIKYIK